MSNAVSVTSGNNAVTKMTEDELVNVLQTSLYPGASVPSIKMVLNYCQAAGLDPMQKPVHIVPIWDGKLKQMRDVVMPGIGLYRTQAARSGQYAGVTEPEFGEDVTETLDGAKVTYPKWCKVTVRRLLPNGSIVDFTATERWKENYATAKRDTAEPNSMWKRRPYAQLAKCSEAQALRKAFPEFGAQPTADEMEGKEIDVGTYDTAGQRTETKPVAAVPDYPADKFDANLPTWKKYIAAGKKTADDIIAMVESTGKLTEAQKRAIRTDADTGVIDGEFTKAYEGAEK